MAALKISILTDPTLRAALAEQFARHAGYALLDASSALLPDAPADWPDALVFDAGAGDFLSLAAAARRQGFPGTIVVIMDGPHPPCPDADAMLPRPLRFSDLLAALAANHLRIGPYRLHGQNLVAPDANLRLTEKEAAILCRLARSPGVGAPREALLRDVWGYAPDLSTRTLETHIHRLRRKMERDPRRPRWLLTTADGYRLSQN